MQTFIVLCLFLYFNIIYCQRVAPGVPPQQYQQPQYQQQQYQQQFQHQQPHQQMHHQQQHFEQAQFQPHQQMHQQQVPPQQVPEHHNVHHGHGHQHQAQVLNTANIENEIDHIAGHLDIDKKDMTTEQLQFYYFKMHDADGNKKLDGCELIKSLIHWHAEGSKGGANNIEERIFKDEELVTLIDPILSMDDINQDGYIDYPEFIQAQRKAAAAGAPPKH